MFAEIQWETGIEEAFTDIATFVPKLVAFLAILVVGTIIAKLIRRVVTKALHTIRFGQLVERSGVDAMVGQQIDGVRLGAQAIYFVVMLTVLKLALAAFGTNPISDLLDSFIGFLPKGIVAVLILVITGVVADKVGDLVGQAMEGRDEGRLATTAATAAVWLIGVFAALDQVQVAQDIVDTLFTTIVGGLGLIIVIKFGVGGIWSARDRFWPAVYDKVAGPAEVDVRPESIRASAGADESTPTMR